MLDSTILVGRSSDDLNYIPTLNLGRIVAILSKPRTCYLGNMGVPGMPVFDQHGKILGIVCRCVKAEGGEGNDMMKFASAMAATSQLILPAADVAKLVAQAKEEMKKSADADKKPDEKKPDEKKPGEKKPGEPKPDEPKTKM